MTQFAHELGEQSSSLRIEPESSGRFDAKKSVIIALFFVCSETLMCSDRDFAQLDVWKPKRVLPRPKTK